MNTLLRFLSIIFCCIFIPMSVQADSLTGRQIMDKSLEPLESDVELTVTRMTLIDSSGNEKERIMKRYSRKFSPELTKLLLVFTEPRGILGVASLTWTKGEGNDDQWTYLPGLGKLKRVTGGGKRSYFMGTDFANEDLASENRNNHRYERQPDTIIDGLDCYVVDAYPEAPEVIRTSGYDHRRIYIRKDINLNIKMEFFKRKSKRKIKTLTVLKAEEVDGVWRPKISVMDNPSEDHKTRSEVLSWDFLESSADPKIFEHRYLERKKHMR